MKGAPKGTPDVCGYCPRTGRAVFIEVKAGTELSEEQESFLDKAKAAGCLAGVARSVSDALKIVRGESK
jgi:hypothetical protein